MPYAQKAIILKNGNKIMNIAKNKSDIIFYSVIALILLIGMFARTYMWINHFGTCDDLGPIASIISESTDGNNLYPQENFSLMQKWKNGIKTIASWHWTYAPLQFILPVFMLDGNQSYQQKLIVGRLPSFLSSVLAIIFFALILLQINKKRDNALKIPIVFGLALLAFSFVYSVCLLCCFLYKQFLCEEQSGA